jgi:hypothetical protein
VSAPPWGATFQGGFPVGPDGGGYYQDYSSGNGKNDEVQLTPPPTDGSRGADIATIRRQLLSENHSIVSELADQWLNAYHLLEAIETQLVSQATQLQDNWHSTNGSVDAFLKALPGLTYVYLQYWKDMVANQIRGLRNLQNVIEAAQKIIDEYWIQFRNELNDATHETSGEYWKGINPFYDPTGDVQNAVDQKHQEWNRKAQQLAFDTANAYFQAYINLSSSGPVFYAPDVVLNSPGNYFGPMTRPPTQRRPLVAASVAAAPAVNAATLTPPSVAPPPTLPGPRTLPQPHMQPAAVAAPPTVPAVIAPSSVPAVTAPPVVLGAVASDVVVPAALIAPATLGLAALNGGVAPSLSSPVSPVGITSPVADVPGTSAGTLGAGTTGPSISASESVGSPLSAGMIGAGLRPPESPRNQKEDARRADSTPGPHQNDGLGPEELANISGRTPTTSPGRRAETAGAGGNSPAPDGVASEFQPPAAPPVLDGRRANRPVAGSAAERTTTGRPGSRRFGSSPPVLRSPADEAARQGANETRSGRERTSPPRTGQLGTSPAWPVLDTTSGEAVNPVLEAPTAPPADLGAARLDEVPAMLRAANGTSTPYRPAVAASRGRTAPPAPDAAMSRRKIRSDDEERRAERESRTIAGEDAFSAEGPGAVLESGAEQAGGYREKVRPSLGHPLEKAVAARGRARSVGSKP